MSTANDNRPAASTRSLTFISMFSGIEAASVAFGPLGWKALAFAEIEKFPSAVLAHHYPDVPNVGDMSKYDWSQYRGMVDIVCGGPPCQAFSVAGLRESMNDARGNLSLVYMRALHAIKPRNAIVENVPGWLNTPDNAFGCFLAGIVGADDALHAPDGKSWPNAGMVAGPLGRAAWRVLDAQYFGLAQRRRRVILVADFGNGADPAAVLFERASLSGNTPPSREARKDVAPTISARTKGGGGLGTDFDLDGGLVQAYGGNNTKGPIEIATAVNAHWVPHGRLDFESETFVAQTVATLDASFGRLQGASGQDANHGHSHLLVEPQCVTGTVTHTLKAKGADASEGGTGRGTPIVAQSVAIRGRDGGGTAELGDEIATALRASQGGGDKPHVLCFSAKDYGADAQEDIAPTLRAGGHADSHANAGVMPAVAFGWQNSASQGDSVSEHVSPTLDKSKTPAVAWSIMPQNSGKDYKARQVEVAQPLMAGGPVGGNQGGDFIQQQSAVRRLTPRECERLQGFQWLCTPDYPGAWQDEAGRWWTPDYTLIPYGKKLKDDAKEELAAYFERTGQFMREVSPDNWVFDRQAFERAWPRLSADGPRYKALGNSWAVPKFRWLGERINRLMPPAAANDNAQRTRRAA